MLLLLTWYIALSANLSFSMKKGIWVAVPLTALMLPIKEPLNEPVAPPSAFKLPSTVKEPVTSSCDEVITCTTIVWAVNVPLTKKSSADDAVKDCSDQLDVPCNEPVNEP